MIQTEEVMYLQDFFICDRCGRKTKIAGFDDWEVPRICDDCELDLMPTMTPDECNTIIKRIKRERGDYDE